MHEHKGTSWGVSFEHFFQLSEVGSSDGDVYLVGVALDGFPIFVTIDNGRVS